MLVRVKLDMSTLFHLTDTDAEIPGVPGLCYLLGYVDKATEVALVRAIDSMPWNTEWKRRRQPYGAEYGNAGELPAIPDWGRILARRMHADGITERVFDQMLVNEYMPGQGISSHRDYASFGRAVVSLSLFSPCVMDFRHRPTGRKECLLLEARSLLVLSDEARYEWEHGIAPRRRDVWQGMRIARRRRLSVTFRFREAQA
jgi:alkylated DNA repair dioxygenase AlkB